VFGSKQAAPEQPRNRSLRCGAGKPGFLGECSVADGDSLIDALLLGSQPQVNNKRGRFVIVADQIAHEGIDDVAVERDGGHEGYTVKE